MNKYYTIAEVANHTGISAHTLRYYDKEGLLTFVKRDDHGIRQFTEDDFEPLYTIVCLKKVRYAHQDDQRIHGLI